jgi:secreted trypsin-like serine protease
VKTQLRRASLTTLGAGMALGALTLLGASPASAVVGGRPVAADAYPWMVSLVRPGKPTSSFCGGTLVSPTRVVTAAHCPDDESASSLKVLVGRQRLSDTGGQVIDVKSVVVPRRKNGSLWRPDVAVLKLAKPVTGIPFPRVATTAELSALREANAPVKVIGWGVFATSNPNGRFSRETGIAGDRLREGDLTLVPDIECEGLLGTLYEPRYEVCGGAAGTRVDVACWGDSGGPLVATLPDGVIGLVGVVSGGTTCGQAGLPGWYGRVDAVRKMILGPGTRWKPFGG